MRTLLLTLSCCFALMGCRQASGHESAELDRALLVRGAEVYREQSCGVCHTLGRTGAAGVFGPPHDGIGRRAEERLHDPGYRGTATTVQEYLRESVLDPGAYRVPGYEHTRFAMPAYTELSEEDLDALVAMLAAETGSG